MPKSRSKIKKSIMTSAATIIGLAEELESCCAKRDRTILLGFIKVSFFVGNCRHDRLTEKLKILQQSKSSLTFSSRKLYSSNILSKLFLMNNKEVNRGGIYSTPVAKLVVLEKHQAFAVHLAKTFNSTDDLPYCFTKTNLKPQIQYRMISLVADPFSDQMDRMEASTQIKINLLRINHVHLNNRLPVKIISTPIFSQFAVHIVVQDENTHCLRLSIYNWSHMINTRQIKSYNYIQERLTRLLTINSCIVLLDPWLKTCQDGEIALRCESPNTHLLMIDFETRCSTNNRTNVDQLRQWGNTCYQADDNLAAIEYYTYGLRQIDEQQDKSDECQQHRIRLLSNRCACYLRERHAALALADTSVLLSINQLSHVLESPKTTAGKLLFRCLSAHLHLGLFDKVESLIKSHPFGLGLTAGENSASMAILERELSRLRDESIKGRYDLQGMLKEQIGMNQPQVMFIDLPHYHAECNRNDLFEIRLCQTDELNKNRYPKGSYGVYALKNIEPGTLLVVEQPFASIDNRVTGEQRCHSINYWEINVKNCDIEYFNDDTLRLLNEIEKQLLIGNTSWITFDKLKLIQPIRQWLAEIRNDNVIEQEDVEDTSDLLENDETTLLFKKQWRKPFSKRQPPPASYIPWRILFETQRQNPFYSKSTLGWYSLGSMFNHSCLPNCLWYLIGDCLFIYVCASNIRQGDELTISYCPLWISSLTERTNQLRRFGIISCQCLLCSYDRSNMPQYEIELKNFSNLRALSRQKNLSCSKRFGYVQKLKRIYEYITKKFKHRPMGFITEFGDLEYISHYFQHENEKNDQIQEFLNEGESSFLQRLSRVCRFTIKDLPKVGNPIVLFGTQMQLLIYHLEHCYARVHSCDLKQWNRFLECLYEIFTFKCHSASSDMQKTLKDHEQLFTNLLQTQTFLQSPSILE